MEIFNTLPELTADQLSEINREFTAYIFYEKENQKHFNAAGVLYTVKMYHCNCTSCNEEFYHDFDGLKHNDTAVCPLCGRTAMLKHISRGKKNLYEQCRVAVICPENENKVWVRAFYAFKSYNGDPYGNKMLNRLYTKADEVLTPEIDLSETARYLLEPGKARFFRYEWGWHKTHQWAEKNRPQEPFLPGFYGQGADYSLVDISKLLKTFLRYADFRKWYKIAEKEVYTSYKYVGSTTPKNMKYLCALAEYSIIESIMKAGFGDLVGKMIFCGRPNKRYLNWNASRLTDFFKAFTKAEIKLLKEEDYQEAALKIYGQMKKIGCNDFHQVHEDIRRFDQNHLEKLLAIIKKYDLSYVKAKNYIGKQNDERYSINIWHDYLDMAERLGFDMKNSIHIFPKNLQKAHDDASKNIAAVLRMKEKDQMKDITEKLLKRYSFSWQGLEIVVPETMQDIIAEGKALSHCVGGYAERHAAGKLAILFIRRSTDLETPFVTMEVRGTDIVQYHGYGNDRQKKLPQHVKDFVAEFKEYINNPAAYKKKHEKEKKSA